MHESSSSITETSNYRTWLFQLLHPHTHSFSSMWSKQIQAWRFWPAIWCKLGLYIFFLKKTLLRFVFLLIKRLRHHHGQLKRPMVVSFSLYDCCNLEFTCITLLHSSIQSFHFIWKIFCMFWRNVRRFEWLTNLCCCSPTLTFNFLNRWQFCSIERNHQKIRKTVNQRCVKPKKQVYAIVYQPAQDWVRSQWNFIPIGLWELIKMQIWSINKRH